MQEEKGYVYAFTREEFHQLKQLTFQHRFHSIAVEGRREFEAFQKEFAENPGASKPEVRMVDMRVWRVDEESSHLLQQLQEYFPQYFLYFVTNRTVHEMFKRLDQFRFLGTVPMDHLSGSPREILNADFAAIVQPTNQHLWAER
jgi:hypothetical protein